MKRFICLCLSVVLLSIAVSCGQSNNVSEIINDYDKCSEELYSNGLNAKIEQSNTKTGEYLNNDGNVLTIISSDEIEYMFFKVNNSNDNYPDLKGDVCAIHLKKEVEYQDVWIFGEGYQDLLVSCDMDICIEFRNNRTYAEIEYESDDAHHTKSGRFDVVYYDGNFTPDLTNKTDRFQKRYRVVESWITVESLTEYYNQACEYYDILCSVIED